MRAQLLFYNLVVSEVPRLRCASAAGNFSPPQTDAQVKRRQWFASKLAEFFATPLVSSPFGDLIPHEAVDSIAASALASMIWRFRCPGDRADFFTTPPETLAINYRGCQRDSNWLSFDNWLKG